ncbi:head-tail joining protein [Acuticoccus mangrovi]|uniref:Uncharacterized protein n=1 Tax=Acuticoccus mangrovi TaxID=2796142 RepID=A0A934IRM2_9HYPH|nr:hypothetical protein [Acuticoccus mangrovi]MBJ3776394.1 hypothetical protein [Acuticoccus mangrovi]
MLAENARLMTTGMFSVAVTYTPDGGAPLEIRGIPDTHFVDGAADDYGPLATKVAEITVADVDLPAGAAAGDAVAFGGNFYVVREPRPDGTGVTRITLEKVTP